MKNLSLQTLSSSVTVIDGSGSDSDDGGVGVGENQDDEGEELELVVGAKVKILGAADLIKMRKNAKGVK